MNGIYEALSIIANVCEKHSNDCRHCDFGTLMASCELLEYAPKYWTIFEKVKEVNMEKEKEYLEEKKRLYLSNLSYEEYEEAIKKWCIEHGY